MASGTMEPLIHKASVYLTGNTLSAPVSPGDAVDLRLAVDCEIEVVLTVPSRLPFGLGKQREFLLGTLGPQATDFLQPLLEQSAHLRVRVVEIEPAHVRRGGQDRLFISVWGDPMLILWE